MQSHRALIFGVTGQDGSYLSDFLLSKNYEVHGVIRRSSSFNTGRIDGLYKDPHEETKFFLHFGDLSDSSSIRNVIAKVKPDEIYNLAAQSHVRVSFDIPEYTCDVNALGTLRILEAIKDINPKIRFYQASSSEMFGKSPAPQNENTPFYPRSPYGASKVFAYWITKNYREAYEIFACNGILFNHESPRRGSTFVTKKIIEAVIKIKQGKQKYLYLGNLDAKRDWGSAKDYVEAMWLMLQQDMADDYVIATGENHSVKEFLDEAFKLANLDWKEYVKIDKRYFRPAEVDMLCGDSTKALDKLSWKPKTGFKQLIKEMYEAGRKN